MMVNLQNAICCQICCKCYEKPTPIATYFINYQIINAVYIFLQRMHTDSGKNGFDGSSNLPFGHNGRDLLETDEEMRQLPGKVPEVFRGCS